MSEVKIAKGQYWHGSDGWRWRTLGANGEKLGGGESYTHKADALAALMAHIGEEVVVELIEEDAG